ncbi:MAG: ArsR/SmtB family transcription factor [Thermoleophilia bacterium]
MKRTAQLFKALSDDTRLRILGLLLEGELCVCDLVAILGLPQSTVSRHLSYLKHSGLVDDKRQGVWMHYQLAEGDSNIHRDMITLLRHDLAGLSQVRDDLKALRKQIANKRIVGCCAS